MAAALALMVADLRLGQVASGRATLSSVSVYPLYQLAGLPARATRWAVVRFATSEALLRQNERLRVESLQLKGRLQRLETLQAENDRLRELLNASALVGDDLLQSEVVAVTSDPARHFVLLNRGAKDGVYAGQPVLDAFGLMGQVVEVTDDNSRALLITDAAFATPVRVNRTGVRAIAEGIGRLGELRLPHVSRTADIEPGDLLVTSGLGGRFPEGYPVGRVTALEPDQQHYVRVLARPSAELDRSRHVLLVRRRD